MKVIRLIETEDYLKSFNAWRGTDMSDDPPVEEFEQVDFSFRIGLLRDFYVDPTEGYIIARLDNGTYYFVYEEEIINKFKFEIDGN